MEEADFQSRKQLYNHKCLFVCPFINKTPLHPASFIFHPLFHYISRNNHSLSISAINIKSSALHILVIEMITLEVFKFLFETNPPLSNPTYFMDHVNTENDVKFMKTRRFHRLILSSFRNNISPILLKTKV